MTLSTGAVDVVIEMSEVRNRGHLGKNWATFHSGCGDQICIVIEGNDRKEPITWEIGARSIVLCNAGAHYHPRQQYGEEPVEGGVVYLNPVDQDEALWGVSNAETTPQQLWDRGRLPLAVIHRESWGCLDWVIFHSAPSHSR